MRDGTDSLGWVWWLMPADLGRGGRRVGSCFGLRYDILYCNRTKAPENINNTNKNYDTNNSKKTNQAARAGVGTATEQKLPPEV